MTTLTLSSGSVEGVINAEAGGTITQLSIAGTNILFPETMLETPTGLKKRGGIPILFPNAGKLKDGAPFVLKEHGFARHLKWSVVDSSQSSVSMEIKSSDETRQIFPFDFRAIQIIEVTDSGLACRLEVFNTAEEGLPLSPGFHHYFDRNGLNDSKLRRFLPVDYQASDILRYDWPGDIDLEYPKVTVRFSVSSDFSHLVVWSDNPKRYICFEPWERESTDLTEWTASIIPGGQSRGYSYSITQLN